MLTTLLAPTSGTAVVNGFDVVKQADGVRQSIGVIPQAMTSDLELSVEENLHHLREALRRAAGKARPG